MIMAAGIGTRLRPVTDLVPKPMAPIVNRPALYHILRLLQRHGFREVVINLHHLPDAITGYFGDGSRLGMESATPSSPNCWARPGGSRTTPAFLAGGTFLVMSGDALTDIDLTGLVAAHRRNGLHRHHGGQGGGRSQPLRRGGGRRRRPGGGLPGEAHPEEARSRLCNCGIYVFEPEILVHIPAGQFDDFGKPALPRPAAARRIPFHAHAVGGYWSDVGNLGEYIRGNADALAGQGRGRDPRARRSGRECGSDEGTSDRAVGAHRAPVVIGSDCRIGEDVVIEGPTVIGDGCAVGAGAHVAAGSAPPGARRSLPGSVVVDGVVGQRVGAAGSGG